MAKTSLVNRELKRRKTVEKYANKRGKLLEIIGNSKLDEHDRYEARLQMQALPRNASPTRLRNRCQITGRPRGVFRKFGLSRMKIRELAFRGEIPGVIKASW